MGAHYKKKMCAPAIGDNTPMPRARSRRCRDTIATPHYALEALVDYLSERRREFQTTLRVLHSYPEDQRHLKPTEKSRTAAELVRTLVIEERVLTSLVNNGATDPSVWSVDAPGSMMKMIEMWQDTVATNDDLLAKLLSEDWARIVSFYGMQIPLVQA